MAEPEEHAYADSEVPWEEEELDESESQYFPLITAHLRIPQPRT